VGGPTYTYDGDGKRVLKSGSTIYWTGAGTDTLSETDTAGTILSEYAYFGGKRVARVDSPLAVLPQTPSVHYYFADHLGSANVITSSSGGIQRESMFYPFGGERVILAGDANHYKFTGKERDTETGLDYFGARYYGSNMGRWMSPDWSGAPEPVPYADFGDPQTLNLYGYVRNNPLSHADADGHCCSDWADWIDSKVQTFRQDGMSANNLTSSPTLAAVNTFANGVTSDLASGAADVLRLGNGTAAAIDSAKQGDYAGAAIGLAQDGGRAAGVILTVAGLAPGAKGTAPAAETVKPVGNDLGLSSTTKTTPSGKTVTTVTDPAGSTTYKTTPGKTGGQSTYIIRKDASGNVKYVKQEAWTKTRDVTKEPDHVHYYKPKNKEVR
jgi:RHS repeat-associated protein